jgi:hypothetical protein
MHENPLWRGICKQRSNCRCCENRHHHSKRVGFCSRSPDCTGRRETGHAQRVCSGTAPVHPRRTLATAHPARARGAWWRAAHAEH